MLKVQGMEVMLEVFDFPEKEAANRRLFRGGRSLHILEGRGEDSRRQFKCENKVSEKTQGSRIGNGSSCFLEILKLRNTCRGKRCRREHCWESIIP